MIPEGLPFDREVSDGAKVLLLVLIAYAEVGFVDPTRQRLAYETGVSVDTVKRRIAELERRGWLTVFRTAGASSVYSVAE